MIPRNPESVFNLGTCLLPGCAEYYLMEPSSEYSAIMHSVREKIYMSKLVIEFVTDNWYATYEDLLNKLSVSMRARDSLFDWCRVVRLYFSTYQAY